MTGGKPIAADATGAGLPALTEAETMRVAAAYGPLANAVRELVEATVLTDVDDDVVMHAKAAIEAVTESLRERSRPAGLNYIVGGVNRALGNAVVGVCNPLAPPLVVHHEAVGRCWSEFVLGPSYEGPPNLVHGGISAMILDQLLGEAASERMSKPRFTGTITVRYLRSTPLGEPLRCEAWIDRIQGFKSFARGTISDSAGITVEAEGIFIVPGWARDPS